MVMPAIDAASIPILTALATLIAAAIGGIVAVTIALVNASAQRRIELDRARRAYRAELSKEITDRASELAAHLERLRVAWINGDRPEWDRLVSQSSFVHPEMAGRRPNDETFDRAVICFEIRRSEIVGELRHRGPGWWSRRDKDAAEVVRAMSVISISSYYAARVVHVAAEGYVFNSRKDRRRADRMMKGFDSRPLRDQIETGSQDRPD